MPTSFQPLYQQVYRELVNRIGSGVWLPGESLPSEIALASELAVSQGTVRKAINQLTEEKVVLRRQGVGTFVAEHDKESGLSRFFRLRHKSGSYAEPSTTVISVKRRKCKQREAHSLHLGDPSTINVIEIQRLRSIDDAPLLLETIVQSEALFPNLHQSEKLDGPLYQLYQQDYGIHVIGIREQLRAASANSRESKWLEIEAGDPILNIERVTYALDKQPVQLSLAATRTDQFVYSVDVS